MVLRNGITRLLTGNKQPISDADETRIAMTQGSSITVKTLKGDELEYFTISVKGNAQSSAVHELFGNHELKSSYADCSGHTLGVAVLISTFYCSLLCYPLPLSVSVTCHLLLINRIS